MRPDDVRTSKRLSYVLRHRPDSVGLTLDAHGWVAVDDLLAALAAAGSPLARADLDRVVGTNDKQRFEVDRAGDRIRARQGHSVEVDLALTPADPPPVLFHGTPARNLPSVLATGLDRRGRHHVHLSGDVDTARRVGRRRGDAVVLEVDAGAMVGAGATFWRTGNGVWLTDRVPPEHLSVHP
ncbi:RNA 2'-phosphotransferase [Nocardioides xinjiangensis]|uniref:RNA 2'-phosphotransferase n=1 Tax=Nocardioides xinjiangensis TaxID=2817376 RepID=UPI001B3127FD|nr:MULTISPECIES: RNA 2'-phosphotransferase [unclassified Nocardioides]